MFSRDGYRKITVYVYAPPIERMYTVTYYKLGNRWYLDAPDYLDQGGPEGDLERVGAFCEFLELAGRGASTVIFHMDTVPFDGADRLQLVGSSGGDTGGYYYLSCFQGQDVDLELWFNTMIYIGHTTLPQAIYIKRIIAP